MINFHKHGSSQAIQCASLHELLFPLLFFCSHAHSSAPLYGSVQSFNRPTCISFHLSLESNCVWQTLMKLLSPPIFPLSSSGKPKEISFKHPCQDHHASTSPEFISFLSAPRRISSSSFLEQWSITAIFNRFLLLTNEHSTPYISHLYYFLTLFLKRRYFKLEIYINLLGEIRIMIIQWWYDVRSQFNPIDRRVGDSYAFCY